MVSKNNLQHKLAGNARHIPHYGLRKLSVGVASVLLSTTLYFGATAHADVDSVNQPDNNPGDSSEETSDDISNLKIQETTVALKTSTANNQQQVTDGSSLKNLNTQSFAKTTEKEATNFADNKAYETSSVKSDPLGSANDYQTMSIETNTETDNSVNALQANLSENFHTNLNTDDVTAMLNRSEFNPKNGEAVTMNIKMIVHAGDTYTITVGKGAFNVEPRNLTASVGTTGVTKNQDGSVTITNTFKGNGTYNQVVQLTPFNISALYNLIELYSAGHTEIPIDIKKNGQEVGQLSFDQIVTPQINPTFERTSPAKQAVDKVTTGVDYQWTLKLNEDAGLGSVTNITAGATQSIDHGTTVTIPVPVGFELNQGESERLSEVWTASQPGGIGTNVIFTSTSGDKKPFCPIILVGHFTQPLTNEEQTITSDDQIKVVQDTGNGTHLNASLPPFSEKLMRNNVLPDGNAISGEVAGAYNGSPYPQGDIPLSFDHEAYKLWSYSFGNQSAFNLKNVNVHINLPDGAKTTKIDMPVIIDQGIVKYKLHLHVDAAHPDEIVTGSLDLSKNKIIDLTRISGDLRSADFLFDQLNSGERTNDASWTQYSYGIRVSGYLNQKYDNGQPLRVGDMLTSTLSITTPDIQNISTPWTADQHLVAKIVQPVSFTLYDTQLDKTPGKLGGFFTTEYGQDYKNKGFVNPIFYYVLPTNADYAENYNYNRFLDITPTTVKPKVSTFKTNDGRTILKVDYSGTGSDHWLPANAYDMLYLNNKADAGNSSSNYKVYVVAPEGMKVMGRNGGEANKVAHDDLPYVEGHAGAYLIGSGNWITQVNEGIFINEQSQGNKNLSLTTEGESDNQGSTKMTYTGSVVNGSSQALNNVTCVLNLPETADGKSGFNFRLDQAVSVIDTETGQAISGATIEYSSSRVNLAKNTQPTGGDFGAYQADQLANVRAIRVTVPSIAAGKAVRVVMNGVDPTLASDVGKIGYLSSVVYTSDGTLKPYTILPTDKVASSVKVTGVIPEKAMLTFHDDTADIDLSSVLTSHGQAGSLTTTGAGASQIQFTNVTDLVNTLTGLHYKFNGVSGTGSNGAKDYGQVNYGNFDEDPSKDQSFVLHFVHDTNEETSTKDINLTVNYKYANNDDLGALKGTKAHDPKSPNKITFTKTTTTDLVTDQKTTKWDKESATFDQVDSPSIPGYIPDRATVKDVTVTPDDNDQVVTVTYTPDAQKLTVTYIDDTTGQVLKRVTKDGHSDQSANYNTGADIRDFESQHYRLVSDSTNGQDLVFDHDDNVDQSYTVHLTHQTEPVSHNKTVTLTINYVDGQTGQHLKPSVTQTVTFTQTGTKDLVTGHVTWEPTAPQSFNSVTSPRIGGYNDPSIPVVDDQTVTINDNDTVVDVIYTKTVPVVPGNPDHNDNGGDSNVTVPETGNETTHPSSTVSGKTQEGQVASKQQVATNAAQPVQKNHLPQTGNNHSNLGLLGLVTAGFTGLLGWRKKKES